MRIRELEAPGKNHLLVFDTGDSFQEGMMRFARDRKIVFASFSAIGAFSRATLAFFVLDRKQYDRLEIEEQVEVTSLTGNISRTSDGEIKIHAHAVLGRPDYHAVTGHLMDGVVRPTLEVFVTESPTIVQRAIDETTGLALIRW